MGTFLGHAFPGSFVFLYGFWYALKHIFLYLRKKPRNNEGYFRCCGKIRCPGIVIEGVVKIILFTLVILVEMGNGGPMGRLVTPTGSFYKPKRWEHGTLKFFFVLPGVSDILSHTARHNIPKGLDRFVGAFALFVEGYILYFHQDSHSSLITTRVHLLLVISCWGAAVLLLMQPFLMDNSTHLHIVEMFTVVLFMAQGTWFWQIAIILYPSKNPSWDPCRINLEQYTGDCNDFEGVSETNKFIAMFWTWHVASCMFFLGILYFLMYQFLKIKDQLDSRFFQP